jgi:hypothetical protein
VPQTLNFGETKQISFRVRGQDLATTQPLDPSVVMLQCGFTLAVGGEGEPPTWYPGSWDANTVDNIYWGMVLVGPNGVVSLARGLWTVWANFTLGAETIIQPVLDTLTVR